MRRSRKLPLWLPNRSPRRDLLDARHASLCDLRRPRRLVSSQWQTARRIGGSRFVEGSPSGHALSFTLLFVELYQCWAAALATVLLCPFRPPRVSFAVLLSAAMRRGLVALFFCCCSWFCSSVTATFLAARRRSTPLVPWSPAIRLTLPRRARIGEKVATVGLPDKVPRAVFRLKSATTLPVSIESYSGGVVVTKPPRKIPSGEWKTSMLMSNLGCGFVTRFRDVQDCRTKPECNEGNLSGAVTFQRLALRNAAILTTWK